MTEREKLQLCYELAFFPPRLNEAWDQIKSNTAANVSSAQSAKGSHGLQKSGCAVADELGELLDTALLLHQALPENGCVSQRALTRLALYQARARAFGMVGFIRRLRQRLDRPSLTAREVPGHLVRDIGLPPLARRRNEAGRSGSV